MPPRLGALAVEARPITTLLPLLAVFYAILLFAPEAQVVVYGVTLPAYRLAVLGAIVPALWILARNRVVTAGPMDFAMVVIGFWILLSFMVVYGIERGFVRGTGLFIDTPLVYVIARASVRSPDELRRFLILCLPALVIAGGAMVIESVTGQLLVRPLFIRLFGSMRAYAGGEATGALAIATEFRLGLLRAYGPFNHPILAGAVMVGFLPLFYFSGLRSWPYILGLGVAVMGFFSLSSAAFLALMVACGGIAIYHVKPRFPSISWWMILSILGLLLLAVHVTATNGIIPVIARLTLTPHTADYRRAIWEYGSISVAKHPWFGNGYNQWERLSWMIGDSVDAHFLLLAMRHGLVVPVLMLGGMIYAMIRLGLIMVRLSPRERNFMIGVNMTVMLYLIVGQTVNFFGSSGLVFTTMLAFLASMVGWANGEMRKQNQIRLMLSRAMLYRSQVASR